MLAIFVYTFLFVILLALSIFASKLMNENKKSYAFLILLYSVFIISFLLGFRENVGTDFATYKEWYLEQWIFINNFGRIESGYKFLNQLLFNLNAGYSWLFVTILLIQYSFFYSSFKNKLFLLPYAIICFFFLGNFFALLNIIRQGVAFCIFLYSIKYITNKEFIKYSTCIALAMSFHFSAIILLFVYFFTYTKCCWFNNKIIQLLVYLSFVFFGPLLLEQFFDLVSRLISGTIYHGYIHKMGNLSQEIDSGMGILLFRCLDIALIMNSTRLTCFFRKYRFDIYYNIFFMGALLQNIILTDVALLRMIYFFTSMRFIVLAFYIAYIHVNWRKCNIINKSVCLSILCLYFVVFLRSITYGAAGCIPFKFVNSIEAFIK